MTNEILTFTQCIAELEAALREIRNPRDGFGYSEDLRAVARAALEETVTVRGVERDLTEFDKPGESND